MVGAICVLPAKYTGHGLRIVGLGHYMRGQYVMGHF